MGSVWLFQKSSVCFRAKPQKAKQTSGKPDYSETTYSTYSKSTEIMKLLTKIAKKVDVCLTPMVAGFVLKRNSNNHIARLTF